MSSASEVQFLRPYEAAALAGLSTRSIYAAIARGELRASKLCSRSRITREAFDEWVSACAVQPDAPPPTFVPPPRVPVPPPPAGSFRALLARRRRRAAVVSVERIERQDGTVVWRVRWRQAGQNRSKVIGRKRDAEAFDAELRRRRRMGELGLLDAGRETLADFGQEWWKLYAEPNLAPAKLQVYASLWDSHVLPRLGPLQLREITPSVVNRFRLDCEADGVGRVSIAKAMTLLQGVLQRACEWERMASNPVRAVRKPAAGPGRAVVPLPPDVVEEMRAWLAARSMWRYATLLSVLAYAGLRPGEALALPWAHVRPRTLLVESSVSIGAIAGTKTRRRRTVRLLAPLASDLAEWQVRCGHPGASVLVFPGYDGRPWSSAGWKNWRRRSFGPAAEAVGLTDSRPYDLRHSFVSLLIAEGHNVVEVARQAGHSPKMSLDTYAHVFDEFEPGERISAADRITVARERIRQRDRQPTLFDVE